MRQLRDQHRDFAAESIAAMTGGGFPSVFGEGAALATDDEMDDVANAAGGRSRDLSALFQPPIAIMFQGTYAEARAHAKNEGKWLLVNIQDEIVFASHMLNRDTWSDDVVQNLVASGFVFWQVRFVWSLAKERSNYWASEHGKKFCALYQIEQATLPVVAIIDPRTGSILQRWAGFLEPQDMTEKRTMRRLEKAEPSIMDASEDDQLAAAIAASMQENDDEEEGQETKRDHEDSEEEKAEEPVVPLAPEPAAFACWLGATTADGTPDVTRVQIRVPNGSRLTRRFLKTDPLSMVWAFVKDQVPEARGRAFELRTAFPPSAVAFDETLSIEEGKLENASLMVKWL
ncbi:hypothetical protein BBJ28_00021701 [Nothophytophthora sp. Chile5]|nr:hypothetical protein BBJ28_00021701 [Nothophytophthora sp. Chile5]